MVQVIQARVATSAQVAAAVGVFWIAFDFNQPSVFDVANGSTNGATQLTHAWYLGGVFVLINVRPVLLFQRPRQLTNTRCRSTTGLVGLATNSFPLFQVNALRRALLALRSRRGLSGFILSRRAPGQGCRTHGET